MLLKVGDKAPDFETVDQNGNPIKLSSFKGKKVVLYFYPADMTPGCTKEACSFRDDLGEIKRAGAVVIGISTQGLNSHKKFADKHNLNFSLGVDDKKVISKKYGVLKITGFDARVTYIIDEKGKISHVFPKVNPEGHSQEILEVLKM